MGNKEKCHCTQPVKGRVPSPCQERDPAPNGGVKVSCL